MTDPSLNWTQERTNYKLLPGGSIPLLTSALYIHVCPDSQRYDLIWFDVWFQRIISSEKPVDYFFFLITEDWQTAVSYGHLKLNSLYTSKSHTFIFSLTTFSLSYGSHLPWIVLICLCNFTTFISVQSRTNCIEDGRVRLLHKVFSSTSQRFSMGWTSGFFGGQSMCENGISSSLNHSFTV